MVQNYKAELDRQCARKEVKPQDLLDHYEYDRVLAFKDERSQAFPTNQSGTYVRDKEYDRQIQKFLNRDKEIERNYQKEVYDDDAFKRRNFRAKIVHF